MCVIIDIFSPEAACLYIIHYYESYYSERRVSCQVHIESFMPCVVSPAIGCYLQFLGVTNDNSIILYLGGVFRTSLTNNSKIVTEDFVRYPMVLARIRQCQMV